jgi:hypothetical protein
LKSKRDGVVVVVAVVFREGRRGEGQWGAKFVFLSFPTIPTFPLLHCIPLYNTILMTSGPDRPQMVL